MRFRKDLANGRRNDPAPVKHAARSRNTLRSVMPAAPAPGGLRFSALGSETVLRQPPLALDLLPERRERAVRARRQEPDVGAQHEEAHAELREMPRLRELPGRACTP